MISIIALLLMVIVIVQKIINKKLEYKIEEMEFETKCLKARMRVHDLSIDIEDMEAVK